MALNSPYYSDLQRKESYESDFQNRAYHFNATSEFRPSNSTQSSLNNTPVGHNNPFTPNFVPKIDQISSFDLSSRASNFQNQANFNREFHPFSHQSSFTSQIQGLTMCQERVES